MFAAPCLAIAVEPLVSPASLIREAPPRRSVSLAAARGQALFRKVSKNKAGHGPCRMLASQWLKETVVQPA